MNRRERRANGHHGRAQHFVRAIRCPRTATPTSVLIEAAPRVYQAEVHHDDSCPWYRAFQRSGGLVCGSGAMTHPNEERNDPQNHAYADPELAAWLVQAEADDAHHRPLRRPRRNRPRGPSGPRWLCSCCCTAPTPRSNHDQRTRSVLPTAQPRRRAPYGYCWPPSTATRHAPTKSSTKNLTTCQPRMRAIFKQNAIDTRRELGGHTPAATSPATRCKPHCCVSRKRKNTATRSATRGWPSSSTRPRARRNEPPGVGSIL